MLNREVMSFQAFYQLKLSKYLLVGAVDTSNLCTGVVENCEPHNQYKIYRKFKLLLIAFHKIFKRNTDK